MQRYISKAGESTIATSCPCGNITNLINKRSVKKKAITPITMTAVFFLLDIAGVERMSAKKAIMIMDVP